MRRNHVDASASGVSSEATRVAVVTNILPPYRVQLFERVAARANIDLRVFVASTTEPGRHWSWPPNVPFDVVVTGARQIRRSHGSVTWLDARLLAHLGRFRPHVVVAGGGIALSAAACLYCQYSKAYMVLWSDATEAADKPYESPLRSRVLQILVGHAIGYIASSSETKDYFVRLGAPERAVRVSMLTTDVVWLQSETARARGRRDEIREALGLDGPTIVYVGSLTHRKGVDSLLTAFREVRRQVPVACLLLVGQTDDSAASRTLWGHATDPSIVVTGHLEYRWLPVMLAAGDVFCFPTRRDPYGMVLAEAVAAGLPVVTTAAAGAARDLVTAGRNGLIVAPGDSKDLGDALVSILSSRSVAESMGRESLRMADVLSPDAAARAFLQAIEAAAAGFQDLVAPSRGAGPNA